MPTAFSPFSIALYIALRILSAGHGVAYPVTSADLDQLILRMRDEQGVTIVMVTHELASIYAVADRCIMLDRQAQGMIAEGVPSELRDSPPNETVRRFFNREALT